MTKKNSLLISLAICIVVAIIVLAVGSSQSIPDTVKKSVVDTSYQTTNNDKNSTISTTETKGSVVQPPSADTLETLLDEKNEQQPLNGAEEIDDKIAELDQTLQTLDQKLEEQGIIAPKQNTDIPIKDDASQSERLQAIRDRLSN